MHVIEIKKKWKGKKKILEFSSTHTNNCAIRIQFFRFFLIQFQQSKQRKKIDDEVQMLTMEMTPKLKEEREKTARIQKIEKNKINESKWWWVSWCS